MKGPLLKVHWYTDRGRRPSNEDAVVVEALYGDRDLVAVADGMGGHAGGEVASEKALHALLAFLESSNELDEGVRRANGALISAAEENPEWKGMGTTLVALLRVGDEYLVANVGDSRAYRLDQAGIRQITEDHSFTAEAISSGRLSEDEAERSPWRNALTRAVGTDEDVEVDVFGPFPVEPAHKVVLCSDGLYRVMEDTELAREVLDRASEADSARNLVAGALRRGSSDNITVAVVEFGVMDESMHPHLEDPAGRTAASASTPSEPAPAAATSEHGPAGSAPAVPPESGVPTPSELGPADLEAPVVSAPGSDGPTVVGPADPAGGAATEDAEPAEVDGPAAAVDPAPPTAGTPSGSYRPARPAQVSRSRRGRRPRPLTRRRSRQRGLPPWIKREFVPALLLVGLTLALVFVLTNFLG